MINEDLKVSSKENRFPITNIILSPQGHEIVAKHPKILEIISEAVYKIRNTFKENTIAETHSRLDIGSNLSIELIGKGGESTIYLLSIDGQKYVIKVRASRFRNGFELPKHNYQNTLARINILREKLNLNGIHFPAAFIASDQLIVTEYIEGSEPQQNEVLAHVAELISIISYIKNSLKDGENLWKNIVVDVYNHLNSSIKTNNFIKRSDGKIFFIDPFYEEEQKA